MRSRYIAANAPRGLWVIAHRGFSGRFPENTLVSFQAAVDMKADFIELDVHITGDGEIVVIHDADLKRTTDRQGNVEVMNLAEIREADAGVKMGAEFAGQRVPLLAEVFDQIPIGIKTEIKSVGKEVVEGTLNVIREADAFDRVVVSSFHEENLHWVRKLAPDCETLWLNGFEPTALDDLVHLSGPDHSRLTSEFCRVVHERGMAVWTWTANTPEEIRRAMKAGVDGIISNWPQNVMDELGE